MKRLKLALVMAASAIGIGAAVASTEVHMKADQLFYVTPGTGVLVPITGLPNPDFCNFTPDVTCVVNENGQRIITGVYNQ